MNLQVIFQFRSVARAQWLDYCREQSPYKEVGPTSNWAVDQCNMLEKREGELFRFSRSVILDYLGYRRSLLIRS